jgi:cathepsin D
LVSVWAGQIQVGTPPQSFLIDFDVSSAFSSPPYAEDMLSLLYPLSTLALQTGSGDLFVPSKSCTSKGCAKKNLYDAAASSTSKPAPGTFNITYGKAFHARSK